MKKRVLLFPILLLLLVSSTSDTRLKTAELDIVVIDAGHGGKDPGCIGHDKHTYEKDVALDIALKLGALIKDSLPGVKVIYTRESDKFVPLWKRADIANKNNADLFISIHCNANTNQIHHGTETYVMGLHKSKGNLEVSKRENRSILFEEKRDTGYDNFDPNSEESYIMLSLMQHGHRKQSLNLASRIQKHVEQKQIRKNRGVKEAGFVVLWKTTMPSILVETGYLTNADDHQFLTSEPGKTKLAKSIYLSIKELKEH